MNPTTPTTDKRLDVVGTEGGKATVETTTALAPARPEDKDRAKVPVRMGVMPTNVEEGWRLSRMLAESEMVPKAFRNKPSDVLAAMQLGAEVGFGPMQSLASIAVVNGRTSIWGDGLLALIVASSLYQDHDEFFEVGGQRRDGLTLDDMKADTTAAVCTFTRRNKPIPVTRRFTVGQAKKALLWGKEGPWTTFPDRMLQMRARAFAARDTFPDLLRGIHTAEEARDLPPVVVDQREVRRISESRADFIDREPDTRHDEPPAA